MLDPSAENAGDSTLPVTFARGGRKFISRAAKLPLKYPKTAVAGTGLLGMYLMGGDDPVPDAAAPANVPASIAELTRRNLVDRGEDEKPVVPMGVRRPKIKPVTPEDQMEQIQNALKIRSAMLGQDVDAKEDIPDWAMGLAAAGAAATATPMAGIGGPLAQAVGAYTKTVDAVRQRTKDDLRQKRKDTVSDVKDIMDINNKGRDDARNDAVAEAQIESATANAIQSRAAANSYGKKDGGKLKPADGVRLLQLAENSLDPQMAAQYREMGNAILADSLAGVAGGLAGGQGAADAPLQPKRVTPAAIANPQGALPPGSIEMMQSFNKIQAKITQGGDPKKGEAAFDQMYGPGSYQKMLSIAK